ncbi:MAG: NAD-binding protein [bacterium]
MAEKSEKNRPTAAAGSSSSAEESSAAPVSDEFFDKLQQGGHVVICNWNSKGTAIINELHSEVIHDQRLIVVVTDKPLPERLGKFWRGVFTVTGNPLENEYLMQAMITKAHSAIILADEDVANPDTANFMLAASIERINPKVHTIVEITQSSYLDHFEGTGVDEMICVNELAEKIISQSCLTHGLSVLYLHLLTASEETNEIYIKPAPEVTFGHTYREVRRAVGTFEGESLILLGFLSHVDKSQMDVGTKLFQRNGKRMVMVINPTQNNAAQDPFSQSYVIQPGDELVLMAYEEPEMKGFTLVDRPKP